MQEGLAERRPLNSHHHIFPVDPASNFRNNCDSTSHSLAFLTSKVLVPHRGTGGSNEAMGD